MDNNKTEHDTLLTAIKNRRLKEWFYYLKNGHPFLLKEEADIICETRFDDDYKHLNDIQIQMLIQLKIQMMYDEKYPDAKRWSLSNF